MGFEPIASNGNDSAPAEDKGDVLFLPLDVQAQGISIFQKALDSLGVHHGKAKGGFTPQLPESLKISENQAVVLQQPSVL